MITKWNINKVWIRTSTAEANRSAVCREYLNLKKQFYDSESVEKMKDIISNHLTCCRIVRCVQRQAYLEMHGDIDDVIMGEYEA